MKSYEFNYILQHPDEFIGRQVLVVYSLFWSRSGMIYKITPHSIFYHYDYDDEDCSYLTGRIWIRNIACADVVPEHLEYEYLQSLKKRGII